MSVKLTAMTSQCDPGSQVFKITCDVLSGHWKRLEIQFAAQNIPISATGLTENGQFLPQPKSIGDDQADDKLEPFPFEILLGILHWGSRVRTFDNKPRC